MFLNRKMQTATTNFNYQIKINLMNEYILHSFGLLIEWGASAVYCYLFFSDFNSSYFYPTAIKSYLS